ncbi:ankyrin repeat and pleckstrin domain-containing protein [Acrasis kona]|uniref:Ankyrin repeat and pleckstrin domain-containing protein n=1 Tax=Acrasis kona TaxID=1008807 RepID=A0AAW2YMZ9_9EUKA
MTTPAQRVSAPRASLIGYKEIWDETHKRYYYYNPETKETTWIHPKNREQTKTSSPTTPSSPTSVSPTADHKLTSEQESEARRILDQFDPDGSNQISFSDMKECLEILLKAKMELDFYEHYVQIQFGTRGLNRDVQFHEFLSIYSRILNKNSPPPMKRAVRSSISTPALPHYEADALNDEACTNGKKKRRDPSISSQFEFYCSIQPSSYTYTSFTTMEKFIILQLSHMCGKAATDAMELELQHNEFLWAVMKGDMNTVLKIQSNTPNFVEMVNQSLLPTYRLSAVHFAVASGNLKLLEMFTGQDFRLLVDRPALNNLSPLHVACVFGIKDAVNILLERGCYLETVANACPYLIKESTQHKIVYSLWIMKSGAPVAVSPLLMACLGGSIKTVDAMINAGAAFEQETNNKLLSDPLSCAISSQSNKLVSHLLKTEKFNVNHFDHYGYTTLMLVALCSPHSGKMCNNVLTRGANINLVHPTSGNAAIHMAVTEGNVEFIESLCQFKANTEELAVNVNICNQLQSSTPLQLCAKIKDEQIRTTIFNLLNKHGAKEKRQYSEIIKEGYLIKEGNIRRNWKKRWFVLKRDSFRYFKDVRDLKNEKGSISLAGAEVDDQMGEKKRIFCIAIKDKTVNRTFFLQSSSAEEKSEWCAALRFVMEQ